MGAFIPKRTFKRVSTCFCRWCATRKLCKHAYKLRDGPVDWYFCNDEHALLWLEHRHLRRSINAVLHMLPNERVAVLRGQTIEEYVHRELSGP